MLFSLLPLFFLPLSVHSASPSASTPASKDALSLNLYHRIHHPIHASESRFVPLGSLVQTSSVTEDSSQPVYTVKLAEDTATGLEQLQRLWKTTSGEADGVEKATYQVALQRAGDTSEGHWAVSVVKACHVTSTSSSTLVVRLSPTSSPFAINYFVDPVPHDGVCPSAQSAHAGAFTQSLWNNATVLTKGAGSAPIADLRAPPQLSAEGAPVEPVPEKTFFQKYWLYGVGIVIALALSGGPEEEKPASK